MSGAGMPSASHHLLVETPEGSTMSPSYLIASWSSTQLWYSVPLIVAISLVYGATRHELMVPILHHAWRTARWIVGFMAIVVAILVAISFVL